MPVETARRYDFQYGGIAANAPRDSGVFALFRGEELCYVDGAASIYSALMDLWHQKGDTPHLGSATSFSFERCVSEWRYSHTKQVIFRLRPAWNDRPDLKARER